MFGIVAAPAEDDHQLVPGDLVDVAARALHQRDEPLEVGIEHGRDLGRVVALREAREPLEVGEEHAHVLRARERLVEVEGAEALFVPLRARGMPDHEERAEHE